eukprot:GFUD01045380.1.p1 GENE.GFUD01045380.1~~GFUD01045380.1.p1  ORF type:complete len:112 (-),score=9.19 GFUD01045380.1:773-1108(-)
MYQKLEFLAPCLILYGETKLRRPESPNTNFIIFRKNMILQTFQDASPPFKTRYSKKLIGHDNLHKAQCIMAYFMLSVNYIQGESYISKSPAFFKILSISEFFPKGLTFRNI